MKHILVSLAVLTCAAMCFAGGPMLELPLTVTSPATAALAATNAQICTKGYVQQIELIADAGATGDVSLALVPSDVRLPTRTIASQAALTSSTIVVPFQYLTDATGATNATSALAPHKLTTYLESWRLVVTNATNPGKTFRAIIRTTQDE